ncbi:formyl transferase [Martelella sp. FOR1707]
MKIAMLLRRGASSAILANAVRAWHPNAELLLIVERPANKRAMLRFRRRRLGMRVVTGQLLFQVLIAPLVRFSSKSRLQQIMADYNLNANRHILNDSLEVASVNEPDVPEALTRFMPDVVLVNGTRIIKPNVLGCVGAPFINMHAGITPMYRGVHGGYWAMWNGDPGNFGSTIHLVDPGVDTGRPLRQVRIRPSQDDTFATYPLLQQAAALNEIRDMIADLSVALDRMPPTTSSHISRQWFHPTIGQYLAGRLRGVK